MLFLRARIVVVLAALAGCPSSVATNTGGAGGASSSSHASSTTTTTASSTSSGTSASSTTSSSSTSTTTSSTSATSSAASTGSGGGKCPTSCTNDADCQSACPDPGPGMTHCCNLFGCYAATECAAPCVPGGSCQPGSFCSGSPTDPSNCVDSCTCDSTGHYACTLFTDYPSCPAVHPACGSPCDPSPKLYCKCAGDGGAESCTCDPATSTWNCALPICSLFDTPPKANCGDFPVGTSCGDVCSCELKCGVQVWMCGI